MATAQALPSRPIAASRRSCGSEDASFGSTSESGDSGTFSSPIAVLSSKRPATFSSESSVAAVTFPVFREIRLKATVEESPGRIDSMLRIGSPTIVAPDTLRG